MSILISWLRQYLSGFSSIKLLFFPPFHIILFGRKSLCAGHYFSEETQPVILQSIPHSSLLDFFFYWCDLLLYPIFPVKLLISIVWLMPCTSHQITWNVIMIHISNYLVRMVTAEVFIVKGYFLSCNQQEICGTYFGILGFVHGHLCHEKYHTKLPNPLTHFNSHSFIHLLVQQTSTEYLVKFQAWFRFTCWGQKG